MKAGSERHDRSGAERMEHISHLRRQDARERVAVVFTYAADTVVRHGVWQYEFHR